MLDDRPLKLLKIYIYLLDFSSLLWYTIFTLDELIGIY